MSVNKIMIDKIRHIEYSGKIPLIAGLLIYRIILELTYAFGYSSCPNWNGLGYEFHFNAMRCFLSWVQFVGIILYATLGNVREQLLEYAIILMAYIPGLVLLPYIDCDIGFVVVYSVYWLVFLVMTLVISKYIKLGKIVKIDRCLREILGGGHERLIDIIFVCLCISVWLYFFIYTDNHFQVSLFDVYNRRESALFCQAPRILIYARSMANMGLSICLTEYMMENKWLGVALAIITQYINFSIDGSKIIWVTVCVSIGVSIVCKFIKMKEEYLAFGLSVLCVAGVVERLIHNSSDYLIDFGVRRCLLEAQRINYYYYDYFSRHEPDFFRQGVLRLFGKVSPYNESIARIIGRLYFKNPTNATNGLFSEAYSNLGVAGIIIMPVILAILAKVVNSTTKNGHEANKYFIVILFTFVLCGSSMSTAMLSHGILLGMIMSYIIAKREQRDKDTLYYRHEGE